VHGACAAKGDEGEAAWVVPLSTDTIRSIFPIIEFAMRITATAASSGLIFVSTPSFASAVFAFSG
jgi:hypothetical protein